MNVTIGATIQLSGFSSNNFTGQLIYSVIAQDGTRKDYTVTTTVALNDAKDISFHGGWRAYLTSQLI